MSHYVSYDVSTGEVTGYVRSSTAITPIPRDPGEGYAEAADDDQIAELEQVLPARSVLRGRVAGGVLMGLRAESRYAGVLALRCDRPDLDGDGRPELAADGRMQATIIATVLDDSGAPMAATDTEITFRATRGRLSARRVASTGAEAEVTLRSVAETVTARVTVTADGFREASLEVEFVPPAELRELQATQES